MAKAPERDPDQEQGGTPEAGDGHGQDQGRGRVNQRRRSIPHPGLLFLISFILVVSRMHLHHVLISKLSSFTPKYGSTIIESVSVFSRISDLSFSIRF